jgi:hypothetical protein
VKLSCSSGSLSGLKSNWGGDTVVGGTDAGNGNADAVVLAHVVVAVVLQANPADNIKTQRQTTVVLLTRPALSLLPLGGVCTFLNGPSIRLPACLNGSGRILDHLEPH